MASGWSSAGVARSPQSPRSARSAVQLQPRRAGLARCGRCSALRRETSGTAAHESHRARASVAWSSRSQTPLQARTPPGHLGSQRTPARTHPYCNTPSCRVVNLSGSMGLCLASGWLAASAVGIIRSDKDNSVAKDSLAAAHLRVSARYFSKGKNSADTWSDPLCAN